MKQILTVFSYTFKEGIRKKAFLISTAIIMAMILLLCLAPRVISVFQDKDTKQEGAAQEEATQEGATQTDGSQTEKKGICYFVDETGIFQKDMAGFEALYPELDFAISEKADLEELKENVAEHEKNSLIYIENQQEVPVIHVVNANFMKGISAQRIAEVCDIIWQRSFLSALGLDAEVIAASQVPLSYTEEAAGNMDITGYVLGLVMTFIMFFAVYYYGYGVAMSVASEKTSRVMETLIISAKPSRILIGKCLAMGAVGLLQLGGLLAFGLLCYSLLMPEELQIGGMDLTFSGFHGGTIALLAAYFILGYALYAVINSVCGAAVRKFLPFRIQ